MKNASGEALRNGERRTEAWCLIDLVSLINRNSSFRHGARRAIARDDETGTKFGMAIFRDIPENDLKNDDEYCHQAGRSQAEEWRIKAFATIEY